jgi:DNA primase
MLAASRINTADLKRAHRIEDVARAAGVVLRRAGRELVGLSPFKAERTPSFYVDPRKQVFKCFASGEGGDVIRLVELIHRCDFRRAVEILGGAPVPMDGADAEARKAERERERQRLAGDEARAKQIGVDIAREIWHAALPAEGTLVEAYLRHRAIDLDAIRDVYGARVPHALRFAPSLKYRYCDVVHIGPAMVGAILDTKGQLVGVHRTWLAADGLGKARLPKPKLTRGIVSGGCSPLSRLGASAVVGEGYETTLTVMGALARSGESRFFVSGLSLGNICGAGKGLSVTIDRAGLLFPGEVRDLVILGDSDGKNPNDTRRQIARAAAKFRDLQKIRVCVAWAAPGMDFNDMARERARRIAA